jgi:hypothetical protein
MLWQSLSSKRLRNMLDRIYRLKMVSLHLQILSSPALDLLWLVSDWECCQRGFSKWLICRSIVCCWLVCSSEWFMCLSCFQVDIFNNSFGVKSCNCCVTETLQLSGILTILFSAITARRYINHNIPPEAQRASAFVFELIAYLAETSVFLYLGFDVFSSVQQQKSA